MSAIIEAPKPSAPGEAPARRGTTGTALGNAELSVHALAQVREEVHLVLAPHSGQADLQRLAAAYGLGERVRVAAGSSGHAYTEFVLGDSTVAVVNQQPERRTLGELVEAVSPGTGAVPAPASNDGVLSGERVVVLTNYPTHYRVPLFELMSHELAAAGADFSVLFLASGAASRPWLTRSAIHFDHAFVPSIRVRRWRRGPLVPSSL